VLNRRIGALICCSVLAFAAAPRASAETLPPIGHVFIIVLENKDYEVTFGESSPAPYLAKELPTKGQLVTQYFGIGHVSLDNYIAMVSGQAPNPVTQSDCRIFQEFLPGVIGPDGQAIGQGCVYPPAVLTIADQLEAAGKTWGGYMEDMDTPCRHPAVNAQDDTEQAEVGDQYATRHNPFVYFHSIIDDDASCKAHVVDLTALPAALASTAATPNLTFITPDLCHDGHDEPCVDGQPGGLVSANAFLETWVPQILASPAYKQDGVLIVTFDEAESGSPTGAGACCGEVAGPNSPMPGIYGPGGGRVGAVVISQFTAPGTVNDTPYNHYSLLRSLEDIWGLDHLGFAAADGLKPFGSDVFNATAAGGSTPAVDPGGANAGRGAGLPATGTTVPLALAAALALAALGVAAARRARD
jgi:hypothetical protein